MSFNFSCNNWQSGDVNKEYVAQFSVLEQEREGKKT